MYSHLITVDFSYAISIVAVGALDSVFSIGGWLMAAVVVGIGGIFVARRVRHWARQNDSVRNFSLEKLREMRRCGRISDHEFDALKRQAIRHAAAPGPHESEKSDNIAEPPNADDAPEDHESE